MNIYILTNPNAKYDEIIEVAVLAHNEQQARETAATISWYIEGRDIWLDEKKSNIKLVEQTHPMVLSFHPVS